MKPAGVLAILALSLACPGQAPAPAASPQTPSLKPAPAAALQTPSLKPEEIALIESGFETKFKRLNDLNPPNVLGACSGVHLDGYGFVFTTALDLTIPPRGSPFEPMPTPGLVRQRRMANLPVLRRTMREMLVGAAKGMTTLPPNEKIAVAVRLLYMVGDDRTGLPSQVVMSADRASALAGEIQWEEQ